MYQISCTVTPELADRLEDYFCEYVRSNWSLLQMTDSDPFVLQGFFEELEEARAGYAELRKDFRQLPENPEETYIDDQEWQDAYKAFLSPWSHADLHWVPVWERESYAVPAGHTAIYLDAGLAFGTGSHETTRLMARRLLEFRDARVAAGQSPADLELIDAGCGSGILAMSAAKLGVGKVLGFDRDPEAVRVADENRGFNDLAEAAAVFEENGIEEALTGRQADCILANIQADVLKIYAETFVAAIREGGVLALSGILAEEVESVRNTFDPLVRAAWGVEPAGDSRVDGIWCDLCYRR